MDTALVRGRPVCHSRAHNPPRPVPSAVSGINRQMIDVFDCCCLCLRNIEKGCSGHL